MYNPSDFNLDDEMIDELRDLGYELNDYSLSDADFSDLDFEGYASEDSDIILDVPYIPSDEKIVQALLDFAEINNQDTLYDLGCGDGRILVAAALERNARGVGIDMDPRRIIEAMEYAQHSGVEQQVHFLNEDLLEADFSDATVVTLYLLDIVNIKLRPRLLDELRPGTRVVSHAFNMGDWKPDHQRQCGNVKLYKWLIPAKIAGTWQWQSESGDQYKITLKQKYQEVTGHAWLNEQVIAINSLLLRGDLLEVVLQVPTARPLRLLMRCQPKQWILEEGSLVISPAIKIAHT
ncbi:class I SAM-dependent methyltransferase [Oceanisphaera avium]|nr:class I SAM-dependent methyltransferase [Oceanisphaera avium]